MPTWNKRGLRGSILEEFINRSNDYYRKNKLALVQKIPTPITPVEYDNENHHIKLAYFEKKSTVDYIGVIQGVPVCFDAKECANNRFRISNIHKHQYQFMEEFEKQDGIAFILIYFSHLNKYYYMRFTEIKYWYEKYLNKENAAFYIKDLDEDFFIENSRAYIVEYLECVQKDLNLR